MIRMGNQELVRALNKERSFAIGKDIIAVDPSTRLRRSLKVMGVCRVFNRAGSEEVGKNEVSGCKTHYDVDGCGGNLERVQRM